MARHFIEDVDGHWFMVPVEKRREWTDWATLPESVQAYREPPDFAKQIDGPHKLTFAEPEEW